MPSPLLFETADGSHSLFSDKYKVSYHSKYGAVQESAHVFIEAGLNYKKQSTQRLSILEMGFGSGLNALMTLVAADVHQLDITYHTIESTPVPSELIDQLNYPQLYSKPVYQQCFKQMHQLPSGKMQELIPTFNFCKWILKLEDFHTENRFDIIYFDAFAPASQPELWSVDIFQKMYNYLHPTGILVTYCAKGVVKRTLKSVGFTIDAIPGPPGKREMTRAIKT